MALKSSYPSESDIPEGLKEHYKEQSDGSYKLELEGGVKTVADVKRVEKALDSERKQRKTQDKVLKELNISVYDDGSYDEERIETLKNPQKPEGSNEIDEEEIREEERKKWRDEKKELETARESAWQSAEDYVRDSKLRKVLAEKGGFKDPKMLDNFLLQIQHGSDPDFSEARQLLRTIEARHTDEGFEVVGGSVGDEQGLYDVVEKVGEMEIAKHYQPAPDNNGSGSRNNGTHTKTQNNPFDLEKPNRTEQQKIMNRDKSEAKQLAVEAGWPDDKLQRVFAD